MSRPQWQAREGAGGLGVPGVTSGSVVAVAGALYVAHITNTRAGGARTVSSVSGMSLTWTQIASQCSGDGVHRIDVWYAIGSPTTGAVTAVLSGVADEVQLLVTRWGSVDTADPIGQVAKYNTNGASGACSGGVASDDATGSMTVEGTQSVVFAMVLTDELIIYTMTPGWTEDINYSGSSAEAYYTEYKSAQPGALTVGAANSLSGADQWALVAVELRGEPIAAAAGRTLARLYDPGTGRAIRDIAAWQ